MDETCGGEDDCNDRPETESLVAGDTVRLKSGGGPLMTIGEIKESRADCAWWSEAHCEYKFLSFAVASLKKDTGETGNG